MIISCAIDKMFEQNNLIMLMSAKRCMIGSGLLLILLGMDKRTFVNVWSTDLTVTLPRSLLPMGQLTLPGHCQNEQPLFDKKDMVYKNVLCMYFYQLLTMYYYNLSLIYGHSMSIHTTDLRLK